MQIIPLGGITSPPGFFAGATYAGIKREAKDALDLAILNSATPCGAAGVFTTNKIQAAPVILDKIKLRTGNGQARALIVNSGCANACTGELGMQNAIAMSGLAAESLGIDPAEVLIASTGVIGVQLPMNKIKGSLSKIFVTREGGHSFSRAIMTTDTRPKEIAIKVKSEQAEYIVSGTAKGAGMIHPNMATLLGFITTNAAVDKKFLQSTLNRAVETSFNMLTVDGDTSTNDTVLVMANSLAGNPLITEGSDLGTDFQKALVQVCVYLAKSIARDGEGATRLIEVVVNGAASQEDARTAARSVAGSSLVKAAVHGCDPNWGRIVAAAGRSGAVLNPDSTDVYLGNICLFKAGVPLEFDKKAAASVLGAAEVIIRVDLNLGEAKATAWGCDLSEEYVVINSEYTT
jgi:glutamate N-acetyltransferase/amino-acid N-acetyltransferase